MANGLDTSMRQGCLVAPLLVVGVPAFAGEQGRGLFVAPNASDIVRSRSKGTASVLYYVREPFPATETLAFLQRTLGAHGWRSVEDADPGRLEANALPAGWIDSSNDDGTPAMRVWSGRWLNARGDEVTYSLVYRLPQGPHGPRSTHVAVGGAYSTRSEAVRARAQMDVELGRLNARLRRSFATPSPPPCK